MIGTIVAGDAVCVVGWDAGSNRPEVARATRANLATSKTVLGVTESVNGGAGTASVLVAGEVAKEAVTSLGAGDSRIIATDITQDDADPHLQCRLIRVDRPDGSEYVVGVCEANGNLSIVPRASRDTSSQHVFNIKSYGGRPNGKSARDAAMDPGGTPNRVTTTESLFSAEDEGKDIIIAGAGPDGTDLITQITDPGGFVDDKTVDLDANADTLVANAFVMVWESHDNNQPVLDAVAAMPATGGILSFPAGGDYVFDDDVQLPANVQLQIDDGGRLYPVPGKKFSADGPVRCHLFQYAFSGRGAFELGSGLARFSPQNFGAIPDGVTPCDFQFTQMFSAMRATAFDAGNIDTQLAIAELGPGTYKLLDNLVLPGNCFLTGPINILGGELGAVRLDFTTTPGRGVIIPYSGDDRFGRTTAVTLRNLAVVCASLEPATWEYAPAAGPAHEYALGDLIFLPHGAPHDEWDDALPYAEFARVVATRENFDGHVYEAIVGGTPGGGDPFVPADRTWVGGRETTDNAVLWKEVGLWPSLVGAYGPPEEVMCAGDSVWKDGAWNEKYVWTEGHDYKIGDVVLVATDVDEVRTDAVWALLRDPGVQVEGGVAGTPPVAWDPTPGNVSEDGNGFKWTAIAPNFYIWDNGDSKWVARVHAGVFAQAPCMIENLFVQGSTTAKIQLRANGDTNMNNWRLRNLHLQLGTGPGVVVSGGNTSGGLAEGVVVTGAYTGVAPTYREWDFGFRDGSQGSCAWVGCAAEAVTGYGFTANNSNGQAAFLGCYLEGESAGSRMANGVICGGALAGSPELTEDSFAVVIASQASENFICQSLNYREPSDPDKALRTVMCSVEKPHAGLIPLGFNAGVELHENAWAWTTELNARGVAPLGGGAGKDGWWVFGCKPYGGIAHASYAFSGPTAAGMRDFPADVTIEGGGGAGMFWIVQDHLFFGLGDDAPICIKLDSGPPTAATDWNVGDLVLNRGPDGTDTGFAGWSCRKGDLGVGQGTWVPFGHLGYELSLNEDFTTDDDDPPVATPLTFPVRAGDVWSIEYLGTAQSETADGFKYAIDFPAGSWIEGWLDSTGGAITTRSLHHITDTSATGAVHLAVEELAPDRIVATVNVAADGDVTLMVASTTNGDTTTIKRGASLRARRLTRADPPPPP